EKAEVTLEEMKSVEQFSLEDEHPEIIIREMNSDRTLKIVNGILPPVDEIKEIIHYRTIKEVYYTTVIKSVYYTIHVISGLGSGYGGTGTTAFNRLLLDLGLPEDKAKIVYNPSYDNAVITIK